VAGDGWCGNTKFIFELLFEEARRKLEGNPILIILKSSSEL
jgi:hypothetical protein